MYGFGSTSLNVAVLILILLQEDPMAIMIGSEAVSSSFRNYFNVLWKTAKGGKVTTKSKRSKA